MSEPRVRGLTEHQAYRIAAKYSKITSAIDEFMRVLDDAEPGAKTFVSADVEIVKVAYERRPTKVTILNRGKKYILRVTSHRKPDQKSS